MKLSQAKSVTVAALKSAMALGPDARTTQRLIPYLQSGPGIGKTSLANQIAQELECDLVVLSLAQYDYSEIAGWTLPNDDKTQMIRVRPDWMPNEGKGIVFIDELPQAPTSNMNIAAQLVDERRVGPHHLPDGWVVMAAGNRTSDRAGTNTMPTHLRDRLMFLDIEADLDDAMAYFASVGVAKEVRAYLRFRPEWLHKFDTKENACPSPRSWDRVSTVLGLELDETCLTAAIAGQVGTAAAADFVGFLQMFDVAPDIDKLIANPKTAAVPEDPGIMFAVSAAIADRMNEKNAKACITYLERLPQQEFVAFAIKDALSRNADLRKSKDVRAWIATTGRALIL